VLATGTKIRAFLQKESKAIGPKILWHVKEPYRPFLAKFLLFCYQMSLLVTAREVWWMNHE
jgi:hypothetical protein